MAALVGIAGVSVSPSPDPAVLLQKQDKLFAILRDLRQVIVAYSGGTDSAYLAWAAARTLGDQAVAITADSASIPESHKRDAEEFAREEGFRHEYIETFEFDNPKYVANNPDRCFHCKDELFTTIDDELLAQHGLDAVAYGENADDAVRPDRPGSRAATEHAVLRPLADAGMTKADVRAIARVLELPVADKPAAPCLASRIPHFETVTPEKLRQIDQAEAALRRLGLGDLRVRHHGAVARVELTEADLVRVVQPPLREQVQQAVREAGFRFVTVDLSGIQSGAFTLPLVTRS